LLEALVFWQLAAIAKTDPLLVRPLVATFAAANVAHIALLVRYFAFPLPIAFDALIAVGLAFAFVMA